MDHQSLLTYLSDLKSKTKLLRSDDWPMGHVYYPNLVQLWGALQ